ncbi:glutamine amidotransferase [Subtercola boreus]|uniref:Cytoplasmic protein n=1 Tax=Subtercola boreus TaxID=120213 RepID=A0A3E0WAI6_9MICO|nr:glutamine amidotransferase [Subtercola boreus]RFA18983.1 cytoplasmic protein [Subtercola boreus]RFA19110.1 cytoplasmic protein [Subtercola boreus]RFA25709.1 cytoplasmic protein [Subtercola boreus]
MARVLLLGESWFVYSVHQKGFDAFHTSEFTLGGTEFVAALTEHGHSVTHIPAHEITTRLPSTPEGLAAIADVIVVSDVGANTFQVPPATFTHSLPEPDRTEALRAFTEAGGGLLMIGGYLTFSGIDAKARWGRTPLAEALAVTVLDRDDRVELPAGATPRTTTAHPITEGLDASWPKLLGLNEVTPKTGSLVLAECAGHPLLVVGEYGRGRSAAFTSDLAPHWAPPPFLEWAGYGRLFDRTVRWLAGERLG